MSDKTIIKIKEDPIILRMSKQGIIGRSGPQGIPGNDGITWELVLKMENSPENSTNGTCTMWLYKNGEPNTEIHYAFVQILPFQASSFSPVMSASHNITDTYSFQYLNARCIFVTIYEDNFRQKVLCAASVNYGRSATVSVGTVQQGSTASVSNSGTDLDAILDFVLPKGDAATIRVARTDTLPAGSPATVENIGTINDARLVFGIPNGGGCGAWVTPDPEESDTNMLVLDAGCIYTPSVSEDGIISWTNNFSGVNPAPRRISIYPKGDWSSESSYLRFDIVKYNGGAYLAKKDVPVNTPITNTSFWMKLVDKGDKGDKGDRGAKGAKGDKGDKGDRGDSAPMAYIMDSILAVYPCLTYGIALGAYIADKALYLTSDNATYIDSGTYAKGIELTDTPNDINFGYNSSNNGMTMTYNPVCFQSLLDEKSDVGHNHDSRYYTEAETNNLLGAKAPLASPALTGTPTAPTAADGTNSTQIATTAFVQSAFKANDAMVFKGTIGPTVSGATVRQLPDTHYQGWTYKAAEAGTYAGTPCEIGDMIICIKDGTSANNADWTVIQTNVDGIVTGPASATNNHVAVFSGNSGKTIADSGTTLGAMASKGDAPSDGSYYARKDGQWVAVANGQGEALSHAAWGTITGTLSSQTDLQTELDGKLATAGGAMHGNLQFDEDAKVRFITPADESSAPTEGVVYQAVRFADKNGDDLVGIYMVQDGGDNMRLRVGLRRLVPSTGQWTWFYAMQYYITPDGVLSYGIGNIPAFRKELGLGNVNGNLPITIDQGGTGATDASTALSNLGALPTSGGTMTGNVTFSGSSKLFLKENYTAGNVPTNDVWGAGLFLQDSAGSTVASVRDIYRSVTGTMSLHISSTLNGVENYLRLNVKPDGTKSISVSDAAAWQNAILPDSGWLTLTNATVYSGNIYYRKVGPYLYVATEGIKLVTALAAGSAVTLGSMPTGYVPSKALMIPVFLNSSTMTDRVTIARIASSNGSIVLYSQEGIATNASIHMEGACVI